MDGRKNPGNGCSKLAWAALITQIIGIVSDWVMLLL